MRRRKTAHARLVSEWIVVYADDIPGRILGGLTVFTSEDGDPWEAPSCGVQGVVYRNGLVDWAIEVSPRGFWTFRDGQWYGHDDVGAFWQYMHTYRGPKAALFGRTLPDEEWHQFNRRMVEMVTGINKTNWTPRERRPPEA